MRFGKVLRDNRKGVHVHTSEYFELTYQKYENSLKLIFMAPDEKSAKTKAKSIIRTFNGTKVLNIRKLDSKRLGADITWNKSGEAYNGFERKRSLGVKNKHKENLK